MKKVILFLSLFLVAGTTFAQNICVAPNVTAFSTDASSAFVLWSGTANTLINYTLQYKKCTDTAWTSVNNLAPGTNPLDSNVYTLQNLASCQCYQVRVRANCSSTSVSDWRTKEFRTLGCVEPCKAPSQLFAATRDSMASLNWSPSTAGRTYIVQWKLRSDSIWRTTNSPVNTLTINGLQPCSEYQFRVSTVCSATETSAYSESAKFKTSGCIAPCSTPRDLRVLVSSREAIAVSWITTGARAYEVMYSVGDSAPRTETVTVNAFRLLNIASCKTYKFKVRSICGSATSTTPVYSEWSTTVSVLSEGCARCNTPSRLSYVATETGAVLKWDAITGATSYELQILGPRDSTWRTVSGITGNQYTLTGLTACTWYTYRVKTNCSATSSSVWSAPIRFQTKGCTPVCIAPKNVKVYVNDTVAVISWLSPTTAVNTYRLVITSEDGSFVRELNVTGNTYTLTGLARCKKYKLQIKTVCSNTSTSEIVTVGFESRGCPVTCGTPREISVVADSNKVVLKWANMGATKYYIQSKLLADSLGTWKLDSATTNTLSISGLQTCKNYMFRVAAVCSNGVSAYSSTVVITTGGCPTPCVAPIELVSEIVNDTTASLKFNIVAGQPYTVQYRVAGTAAWTSIPLNSITASALPVRVTGLLKCTTYQWRVTRTCITANIVESAVQSFTTKGCPTPCATAPRELLVTNYLTDSAKLTWVMPANGLTYEVRYAAVVDSSIFTTTPVRLTNNALVMRGLVLCQYYIVQVRSICANGSVSDWVTKQFRFGSSCFGEPEFAAVDNSNQKYVSEFGVYPNPGSESLQVAYILERDANIKVELMNLQGQVVSSLNGGDQEAGNYVQTLDNVANLNTGFYMVVVRANGKVVNTQKWQKQ